jgi:hypothetical protein
MTICRAGSSDAAAGAHHRTPLKEAPARSCGGDEAEITEHVGDATIAILRYRRFHQLGARRLAGGTDPHPQSIFTNFDQCVTERGREC